MQINLNKWEVGKVDSTEYKSEAGNYRKLMREAKGHKEKYLASGANENKRKDSSPLPPFFEVY